MKELTEELQSLYTIINTSSLNDSLEQLEEKIRFIKEREFTIQNKVEQLGTLYQELRKTLKLKELQDLEATIKDLKAYQSKRKTYSLKSEKQATNQNKPLEELYANFIAEIQPYETLQLKEIIDLQKAVERIYGDESLDAQSKEEMINVRLRTFLSTKENYERKLKVYEKFEERITEYEALTELLNIEPKDFHFEEHSVEQIEAEIKQLEEFLQKKAENEVVSESIQEIMEELGYNILASDEIALPTREIDHRIYDFGKDNVINAFTSDNGTVLFEVMGVKKEDEEMTQMEKLRVKEGMDEFCSAFPVIQHKLKEKGIQTKLIRSSPADVRYARAIDVDKVRRKKKDNRSKRRTKQQLKRRKGL